MNNKHNITQLKVFSIHLTDHDINRLGAILYLHNGLYVSATTRQ